MKTRSHAARSGTRSFNAECGMVGFQKPSLPTLSADDLPLSRLFATAERATTERAQSIDVTLSEGGRPREETGATR